METPDGVVTRRVEDDHVSAYRECVADHPLATAFHTLAWRRAVDECFDYEPEHRVLLDAESHQVMGGLPTFRVPELVGRSYKNPFCEYGYPLITGDVSARAALESLSPLGSGSDALVLKDAAFTGNGGYLASGFGAVETGVTYRLPVGDDFDRVRETVFDSDLRRKVRRAEDAGLRVVDSRDVGSFYPLYRRTMRRLGSPQFPESFLEALLEAFGESCRLLVVEDEAPVAGVLAFLHGETCSLFLNGANEERFHHHPNELLYARAIELAVEEGMSVVDFGRSEPGSGVAEFKEHFGATAHRLASFVTPPRHVSRGDVSGYKKLAPVTRLAAPVITHPAVGPRLKEMVHE